MPPIQIHYHNIFSQLLTFQILPQQGSWFQKYQYIYLFALPYKYTQNSFRSCKTGCFTKTNLLSKFKIFCSSFCPRDVFNPDYIVFNNYLN